MSNGLDPGQARRFVRSELGPDFLQTFRGLQKSEIMTSVMLTPRTDPIGALRSSETACCTSIETVVSLNRSVVVVSRA